MTAALLPQNGAIPLSRYDSVGNWRYRPRRITLGHMAYRATLSPLDYLDAVEVATARIGDPRSAGTTPRMSGNAIGSRGCATT